ncbi:Ribosomal protein S2 [Microbacterium sp. cf046]|nr:Ribosomal protein S2 [Microbacterium sp. cf046]
MMAVVTIRQLLDGGVHFGHQTRRWNPKVKRFILTERSGIHIIDLQQSLTYIDKAYEFVKETVAHGGTVLFVGTKKQAQQVIAEQATRVGQPYVNQRWLGGLLTNFQTVSKRLARMKELEELDYDNPADSGFTKKELLLKKRELDNLQKSLGGIRNMSKTPSAIWVVDAKREHLAVNEATKLGIPVIGILDTNIDPDEFQYPIPGNDDAIRSVALLTRIIADAAAEGLIQRRHPLVKSAEAEPLADWERELLEQTTAPGVLDVIGDVPIQHANPDAARVPMPWLSHLVEVSDEPIVTLFQSESPIDGSVKELLEQRLGITFWTLNDPDEWVLGSSVFGRDTAHPVVIRATRRSGDEQGYQIQLVDPRGSSLLRTRIIRLFSSLHEELEPSGVPSQELPRQADLKGELIGEGAEEAIAEAAAEAAEAESDWSWR